MTLKEKISQLPHQPGIYQYFDKNDRLLYVGKAKDLSKRVKSYFSFTPQLHPKPTLSSRIISMLEQTTSLHYIVVKTEHDALILENSLIKQLHPKYNILLRDDKTYPYIYIDHSNPYPRYDITRKIIKNSKINYYGPYSVGARDILDSVYEICKLVQKKACLKSKKLCLYYQIQKCLGPCELDIPHEVYQKELDLALELIQNKKLLLSKLEEKMEFYAQEMRFEEAAELRDRIERIERSQIKSDIDFANGENYDIFAVTFSALRAVVLRIFMRDGKIISSSHDFIHLHNGYDQDEIYQQALMSFYKNDKPPIIAPILIAETFTESNLVQNHLSVLFEKKAHIICPQRGDKKKLVDLALINAQELLKQDTSKEDNSVLHELKNLLSLERLPLRVEVFDNSHMAGEATVGAMIVFENNMFDKKGYRTYHLEEKDEYAQMRETLSRRVASFEKNSPPDLWVIDGGTTLLKLAKEIIQSCGVYIDIIAISKEKVDLKSHRAKGKAKDIIHTLDESFKLQTSDKRLQWVQRLRDEAHRSAITFHKKTKLKRDKDSTLLNLNGISPAKVKKLLNHFGTFEKLKELSLEEISEVLNTRDAKVIKNIYK